MLPGQPLKKRERERERESSPVGYFLFLSFFLSFFFFFFGSNPHHSSNLSCYSDNARSLTHCATRELWSYFYSQFGFSITFTSPSPCHLTGTHSHSHVLPLSALLCFPLETKFFPQRLNSWMVAWILTIFTSQNLTFCF